MKLPIRFRGTALGAVALGLALAGTLAVASYSVRRALAQETDLPGVSADSIHQDFMTGGHPGIAAPAAPGAPAAPHAPDDPKTAAFRRRMHAGDNDVVQVGEDVVVERGEHVLGHVFAMGGNVTVRGVVDDDVVAMGGDVTLEDGAQVRGDVVSLGGQVHKAPTATILGSNVTVGGLPKRFFDFRTLDWFGNGMRFLSALFNLAFFLLLGWVVVMISAERSKRVLARIDQEPLAAIGWGLLGIISLVPGIIAVALVAVLLVVTIIGIPVAVLLLLGYVLAVVAVLCWGSVLGASALGNWLIRRLSPRLGEPTLVRSTLVGIVAVGVLGLVGPLFRAMGLVIPPAALLGVLLGVIGKTIQCLTLLAGVGGVLRARAGQIEPLRMPWGGAPVAAVTPPPPPVAPATPL